MSSTISFRPYLVVPLLLGFLGIATEITWGASLRDEMIAKAKKE